MPPAPPAASGSAPPAASGSAPPAASGSAPPAARASVPAVRPRPGLALPAPEPVLTVDPRLTQATGKPQHGDSVARRSGQSLRRLARPSAQAGGEEARWTRELQHPVTKGRVVAVTSIRGGVGKTTTAALVARTLQRVRQDPVLALEADAALGTLAVRLGAQSVRWSAAELAQILKPSMHLLDITGYLVPLPDGGWLLPASQGRVGPPLDVTTYRTVTLALRRHFAMTVVDCETLPGDVARTAMDTAHARIIVAPMTAEGVGGTRVVLDWLAGLPHSTLPSTVVALTSGAPDQNLDLAVATAHLRETGVGVVHLPYDRHLAAGGPIRTELLASATRGAAAELAAEAVQRAVRSR
ncbi:type VII secretion protein [Streptomyces kunmingensis]|uniref:Type VII secretion protein n=3 Tax=Streptomyces kunmingensis TaxID=68225 RepID=A0ABU6CMT6_9ACTN|nr:type VII secretion protein [Streptomyces kunmingensis]MEB3965526.1 type VII secretion protein [Streptomyces kunmingensis]